MELKDADHVKAFGDTSSHFGYRAEGCDFLNNHGGFDVQHFAEVNRKVMEEGEKKRQAEMEEESLELVRRADARAERAEKRAERAEARAIEAEDRAKRASKRAWASLALAGLVALFNIAQAFGWIGGK